MGRPRKSDVAKREEQALTPMDSFRQTVFALSKEFKAALPPQIPVDKFVRTLITTVQMEPHLLECDRKSILATAMKAAQDGLLLDGREAAPVIFRDTKSGGKRCQYVPMVGGILKKMRQSGEIASASAHVVYEKDVFTYRLGDDERIEHVPTLSGDRGKVIAAYSIVRLKDGGVYREVMSRADLDKVQNVSKAKHGPWVEWHEEMCRKTVLKRVAKIAPSSTDIEEVIDADNEATGFVQTPATQPAEGGRPSYLASLVAEEEPPVETEDSPPEEEVAPPPPPPAPAKEKEIFNFDLAADALRSAKTAQELEAAWKLYCKGAPMKEKTELSDIYNEMVVKIPG